MTPSLAGVSLSGVGLTHANGQAALTDLTLAVAQGERVAIIGPSGAGKTTLLRLLGSALQPSEGRLELLGAEFAAFDGGAHGATGLVGVGAVGKAAFARQ